MPVRPTLMYSLFYNDYNAADPGKRDRIYNMVKSMKEEGCAH